MRQFTPRYDDELGDDLNKIAKHWNSIQANRPRWKNDLDRHRGRAAQARKRAKTVATDAILRTAREEVELQAAETVRHCVDALQMQIDIVNSTKVPDKYHAHVNLRTLIDVVETLRFKCGVICAGTKTEPVHHHNGADNDIDC